MVPLVLTEVWAFFWRLVSPKNIETYLPHPKPNCRVIPSGEKPTQSSSTTSEAKVATINFKASMRIHVCPKTGISPTIPFWGWDFRPSYSRDGPGFQGRISSYSPRKWRNVPWKRDHFKTKIVFQAHHFHHLLGANCALVFGGVGYFLTTCTRNIEQNHVVCFLSQFHSGESKKRLVTCFWQQDYFPDTQWD